MERHIGLMATNKITSHNPIKFSLQIERTTEVHLSTIYAHKMCLPVEGDWPGCPGRVPLLCVDRRWVEDPGCVAVAVDDCWRHRWRNRGPRVGRLRRIDPSPDPTRRESV